MKLNALVGQAVLEAGAKSPPIWVSMKCSCALWPVALPETQVSGLVRQALQK